MNKKYSFYVFLFIVLVASCFMSCENLLAPINSSLSFSLGEEVGRAIEETVTDVKGYSEDSIVKIVATLLNDKDQVIEQKEINKKMNEDMKDSFIFSELPFEITLKIKIDIFFQEGKIFTGLSQDILLTEDNADFLLDLDIVPSHNKITYESDVELDTSSFIKSYFITGKYSLPFPYVEGYSFMGWYTKDGEKVSSIGRDNYLGDVTLKAKWEQWDGVEQVQINAYTADDKLLNDVYLMQGEFIKLSTNTPEAVIYYTTDGSEVDKANATLYTEPITFNKDIQIKAVAYKKGMNPSIVSEKSFIETYTATFNNGGHGTAPENITRIKKGDKIPSSSLQALSEKGYTFSKWTDNNGTTVDTNYSVNGNVTVTANWTKDIYSITYVGCDGAENTNKKSYSIDTPTFALTDPSKQGFTFTGWFIDQACQNSATTTIKIGSTGDLTFYANWEGWQTVETVTFDPPSGELDNNTTITLNTATVGATIHYQLDGGTEQTCTSGSTISLTTDTLDVKAWATKDSMFNSAENTTSYTMKKYTVTFNNANHGTAPKTISGLKKGEKLTAEQLAIDDTNLGVQFVKWTDKDSNQIAAGHSINKSLTLTANWTNLKPGPLANVKLTQKDGIFSFTWDAPVYADFKEVVISFSGKTVTLNKGTNKADINGASYSFTNESEISFSLTAKDTGNLTSEAVPKSMRYNPYNLTLVPVKSTKGAASNVRNKNPTVIELGDWPQTIKADTVKIVDETKFIKINGWNCYKGDDGAYYVKAKGNPYSKPGSADYSKYTFSTGAAIGEGTVYYFKMEPLRWVLLNNNFDGKQLFLCDLVQYSTIYGKNNTYAGSNGSSEARDFLLGFGNYSNFSGDLTAKTVTQPNFLNNAFSKTSRSYLQKVTNVDDIPSEDPIFLLGKNTNELQNSSLGFITDETDTACWERDGHGTDFALCMGANKNGTTQYWTRTPEAGTTDSMYYVTFTGKLGYWKTPVSSSSGIRPGICIKWP